MVLFSGESVQPKCLTNFDRRQDRLFVAQRSAWVIRAFNICTEETRLIPDRAGSLEYDISVVFHLAAYLQGHATPNGILHLTGQGSLPDQLIESRLIATKLALDCIRMGWGITSGTNSFVRLLSILDLALVGARLVRQELCAKGLSDAGSCLLNRQIAQHDRIGPHVCYETVLVELLSCAHGSTSVKAELAAAFLLQRGSNERRGRLARNRLFVSRLYLKLGRAQLTLQVLRTFGGKQSNLALGILCQLPRVRIKIPACSNSFAIKTIEFGGEST